jgi:hypothetical protein
MPVVAAELFMVPAKAAAVLVQLEELVVVGVEVYIIIKIQEQQEMA